MAIKTVIYTASKKILCACTKDAPIKICVKTEFVNIDLCDPLAYPNGVIEGTLTKTTGLNCAECNKYIITYDDSQLLENHTLVKEDIKDIFCQDCLTDWIEALTGSGVTLVDNEDGTATLTNQWGCEFTIPLGGGEELIVEDTNTIHLELTDV